MNNGIMKIVLPAAALVVVAAALLATWHWYVGMHATGPATGPETSWTWTNPLSGKTATIPPGWKEAGKDAVPGATLALMHKTGKSLIYLVHEENAIDVSLRDYAEGRQDTMRRELAVEKLEPAADGNSYSGEGAKLFGGTIANTWVIIWQSSPQHFWRAAVITDPDYKYLEFDAKKIVDSLRITTRQVN